MARRDLSNEVTVSEATAFVDEPSHVETLLKPLPRKLREALREVVKRGEPCCGGFSDAGTRRLYLGGITTTETGRSMLVWWTLANIGLTHAERIERELEALGESVSLPLMRVVAEEVIGEYDDIAAAHSQLDDGFRP